MTPDPEIQQLIDYLSQLTGDELVTQFGDKKGNSLHKLYDRQFKIHYNNHEDSLPDNLAMRHGVNSLFVLALDEVLMEVRSSYSQLRDTVIKIYRTMLEQYFNEEAKKLKLSDNPWSAFVEWMQKGNKSNYENDYFQLVEVETSDTQFGFDIRRCIYFEVFKRAGKPELGPILCEFDGILASSLDDWIQFKRHETIASGDRRCTFRYIKM
ncbi:MAG: L-2-amino-thiazoline-4-carboxylic acid hydrolase [Candidatus Thorarchaeota archaeon]